MEIVKNIPSYMSWSRSKECNNNLQNYYLWRIYSLWDLITFNILSLETCLPKKFDGQRAKVRVCMEMKNKF